MPRWATCYYLGLSPRKFRKLVTGAIDADAYHGVGGQMFVVLEAGVSFLFSGPQTTLDSLPLQSATEIKKSTA